MGIKRILSIFDGKFLKGVFEKGNRFFIFYIFALLVLCISLSIAVANTRLKEIHCSHELVNLKVDYRSKMARLQFESKREEVQKRLESMESELQQPVKPAVQITTKEK